MKKHSLLIFLFLISLIPAFSQTRLVGTVTKVRDGQTVEVATNSQITLTVRILGFEAPAEGQELFDTVRQHLERFVLNKPVSLYVNRFADNDIQAILFENGRDVGLQMVRDGAGWLIADDLKDDAGTLTTYQANQESAKADKRGVWTDPELLSPSKIAALVQASKAPLMDTNIAQAAWKALGPSVEGVFGPEIFSVETGECGGRVTRVIDGDTVQIQRSGGGLINVRLAGIDAPERSQDFGARSTAMLSEMVSGKVVKCTSKKKDRYGRYVGNIEVDGLDVNLSMVQKCGAWHYKKYQSEQSALDRERYAAAESASRSAKCGLWNGQAVSPEAFRSQRFISLYQAGEVFTSGFSGGSSSGGSSGGGTVQVRGYYRSNGTYVGPHTRSAPSRRP